MEDNFDFDAFNAKLAEWKERIMERAIQTNFELIKKNGIDPQYLQQVSADELQQLASTLQIMLDHYQDLEEYEKCQLIFDHLQKVQGVMA
jgi:hypothetical protein